MFIFTTFSSSSSISSKDSVNWIFQLCIDVYVTNNVTLWYWLSFIWCIVLCISKTSQYTVFMLRLENAYGASHLAHARWKMVAVVVVGFIGTASFALSFLLSIATGSYSLHDEPVEGEGFKVQLPLSSTIVFSFEFMYPLSCTYCVHCAVYISTRCIHNALIPDRYIRINSALRAHCKRGTSDHVSGSSAQYQTRFGQDCG